MYNKQFAFYQNILSFENTLYHQNRGTIATFLTIKNCSEYELNTNVLFFQKTRTNFWTAVGIPLSYLSIYYILIIKLTFVLFWMTWNCAKTHFVCECMRVSFGWRSVAADCNSLKSRSERLIFEKDSVAETKQATSPDFHLQNFQSVVAGCLRFWEQHSSTY